MFKFYKQPSETYTIAMDFVGRIPPTVTISSDSVTAVDEDGSDASATVISSSTSSGTEVQAVVQAGSTGTDYRITISATLSNSEVLEEDVLMRVRAKWSN